MHEAGLWGALALPVAAGGARRAGAGRGRPVGGARRRDAAGRRAPPRRRPRAVRPLLRRPRPGRLPRRRPTRAGRPARRLTHEDLSQLHHRARARAADRRAATGAGRGARARRVRRRRGDRPALGLVPRLEAGPRRSGDAALGPLAAAAPVGRLHRRQPRLRPPRRLLHRGPGGHRRRAAAALRVRLGPRA